MTNRPDIDPAVFDPRWREAFTPRFRVWNAMRALPEPATPAQVQALSGVGLGEMVRMLRAWTARGLLLEDTTNPRFAMTKVARERINPPHFTSKPRLHVQRRSGRQRMWSAMRVLRTFDLPTLCMAAGTREQNAYAFVRALHVARYLGVSGETYAGRTIFRLVRDTGPRHPVVRKRTEGSLTVIDLDDRNDGSTRRIRTCLPPAFSRDEDQGSSVDGGVG